MHIPESGSFNKNKSHNEVNSLQKVHPQVRLRDWMFFRQSFTFLQRLNYCRFFKKILFISFVPYQVIETFSKTCVTVSKNIGKIFLHHLMIAQAACDRLSCRLKSFGRKQRPISLFSISNLAYRTQEGYEEMNFA